MNAVSFFLLLLLAVTVNSAPQSGKMPFPLAPPLQLDPSCHVTNCYRNLFNKSDSCVKGEYLHSFKKCPKKFYREDTCCKDRK